MLHILLAGMAFLVLHRVVSAGPLRAGLVAHLGESSYRKVFALASLICLAWLTFGYAFAARATPSDTPHAPTGLLLSGVQLLAILLLVYGVSTRNPTTAGMQDAVREDVVRGIIRVTRHPFLWGICLLSVGHILYRKDAPTLAYFGTLFLLALTGTFSIDAKRSALLGADWKAFARVTSNLPFGAILSGRQHFSIRELGWRRPAATAIAYPLTLLAHRWLL